MKYDILGMGRIFALINILLGRNPDLRDLRFFFSPILNVVSDILRSPEFSSEILGRLRRPGPSDEQRFAGSPSRTITTFVARKLPLTSERAAQASSARSWLELLDLIFGDPVFLDRVPDAAAIAPRLTACLSAWPAAFPAADPGHRFFLPPRPLHVIVPLYKQADLIPALAGSIMDDAADIAAIQAEIILVNDSPDDVGLREALDHWVPLLRDRLGAVELIVNEKNLGFVGSCNNAMRRAHGRGADALLLNSDALLTPGALREMRLVAASDPMISVVSPRSNNATICNSPYPDKFRSLGVAEALAAHRSIEALLPRVSYVPTAVGFCLLIRYEMIDEFGLFDPIYGGGYNEENDLILRCNQRGYRAALANHAFVYHLGSVSFEASGTAPRERERVNRAILLRRYPDYARSVERYFAGTICATQTLLAGLVPDPASGRRRILFDARNVGPYYNGTFELARKMIGAFVARYHEQYDIFIACSHAALTFHGFDRVTWLNFCWNGEEQMAPFAAVIRLAQPFQLHDLVSTVKLAPVSCYLMLDTIALDCQQLDEQNLGEIWASMADTVSTIGYISQFSGEQVRRRFDIPSSVTQFVALCSTDVADYAETVGTEAATGDHVLIVGNHYPHKHVQLMVQALLELPERPRIVVLGATIEDAEGVESYASGGLAQDFVDDLYHRASVLIFPTHYEGFGFPVMQALARQKPVLCRDHPPFREMQVRSRYGHNIHLFESTRAIAQAAINPPAWQAAQAPALPEQDWAATSDILAKAIEKSIARLRFVDLERRLSRVREIEQRLAAGSQAADFTGIRGGFRPQVNFAERVALNGAGRKKHLVELKVDPSIHTNIAGLVFDAASRLDLGDGLTLTVARREDAPVSRVQIAGWVAGVGLAITGFEVGKGCDTCAAVKVQSWREVLRTDRLSDDEFIEQLYQVLLFRDPDEDGFEHHRAILRNGALREDLVRGFYTSQERHQYVVRGLPPLD